MARTQLTDGLRAAADREVDFHPKQTNGKTAITAWQRRADTLLRHANAIEAVEARQTALETKLNSRPF